MSSEELKDRLGRLKKLYADKYDVLFDVPIMKLSGLEVMMLLGLERVSIHGEEAARLIRVDMDQDQAVTSLRALLGELQALPQSSLNGFVYTAETDLGPELAEAVVGLLQTFGFAESHCENPKYGSYFQRFFTWMNDRANSPAGIDAREKAQRALELKVLDKEQAGVDAQQAEAVARVITALERTERCALLVGSLLVVKTQEVLVARNLTQREMLLLSMNPELQMQPERLLELLRQAQGEKDCEPVASMPEMGRHFRTAIEKRAG
ncbi:hypothetical protein [Nocardiopsis eucommiae]|uniref:hypothetical protein n=1 Tax=Nocardiopsis eucommiae TaxID=2831970 RepID=UPI003D75E192